MLYRGATATLLRCTLCSQRRYSSHDRPHKQFPVWGLCERIRRSFNDPAMAALLQHPAGWHHDPAVYRDVYDGSVWRDNMARRVCKPDERVLAFSLNLDGVEVCESKSHSCVPILLSPLNLPPKVRFRLSSWWLCGIIPGPSCADAAAFLGTNPLPPTVFLSFPRPLTSPVGSLRCEVHSNNCGCMGDSQSRSPRSCWTCGCKASESGTHTPTSSSKSTCACCLPPPTFVACLTSQACSNSRPSVERVLSAKW